LHDLPRLTALLCGPRLLIKRDDMTGLAFGGNKPRSLEFLMADALAQGADTIISSASAQSNMLRTTAAAARRLGLDVHLVLRGSGDEPLQGNLLIDHLLGAEMTFIQTTDPYSKLSVEVMQRIALDLKARGRTPYIIDVRSHSGALSILGYIWAAAELQDQIGPLGLTRPIVACAVSSGTTLAGLLLGAALMGNPFRVLGLCVQTPASFMLPNVLEKVSSAASLLGQDLHLTPRDVALDDRWIGPAYAVLTPECVDAMKQIARAEGILVDPVYTSKALAGILGLIGEGSLTSDDSVVFLHTGGTPAIFAYAEQLGPLLRPQM
jgi:1-aminocyclopropane-1-carboxylate deaminase/D-cysteine desulfhydrase-like pyridoxal-dependent ACC family enzyme